MKKNDDRFLLKVVDMYYKDELLQDEIAKRLEVSRTTVSRALTKAKKEGLVKIFIDYPAENLINLEKQVEEKFHLKEVIVVKVSYPENIDNLIAKEASVYLTRIIKNNMILGVAWGYTMKRIIDVFSENRIGNQLKVKGVQIVPLLGTIMPRTAVQNELRLSYSSLLSSRLAELVNGISYGFPAPMYVQNIATKKVLLQEPQIVQLLALAKKSNACILGIGNLSEHSSMAALDYAKKDEILQLAKKGGVGEVIGRVYDKDGNELQSEFNDRMIGLELDDIKKIPTRVGVAHGKEKWQAIYAAVANNIINVLITDELTANILLNN